MALVQLHGQTVPEFLHDRTVARQHMNCVNITNPLPLKLPGGSIIHTKNKTL